MTRLCMLAAMLVSFISSTVPAEEGVTAPLILSYGWPIGPETVRDFRTLDMRSVNVIDIGPDSLSYPPSIRKHYPPGLLDHWRARGKLMVRRCYDRPFTPQGKKAPLDSVTVDDLVLRWSTALAEPGVDGIVIDEFIKDDPGIVAVWIEALRRLRADNPRAPIFCWIAGKGLNVPALHRAIRDYADYCMPEIYYRESTAAGYPDFAFPRFREAVDILESGAPGISAKILMGVGVHEKLFDDVETIDYRGFMEAQLRSIARDPVLSGLPGLAFYTPVALSQKNIRVLDDLIIKYFIRHDDR